MKITTVTYAQLLNLANFENVRIEWTAALEPDDNPFTVTRQLGRRVRAALQEEAKPASNPPSDWVWQDDDGRTIP